MGADMTRVLLLIALGLSLAGCESFGLKVPELKIPFTEDGALKAFKPIQNSALAPCPMQKEVAQHNSVFATLSDKKETTFKAPCEVDPPKPAPTKKAATKAVS